MYRVGLVDDHPIMLAGLTDLISNFGEYEVIATGGVADAAISITDEHAPDLLVLDLHMPGETVKVISRLTERHDAPKILIFTASDRTDDCIAAIEAGADGYVVKGSNSGELFQAIRGGSYAGKAHSCRAANRYGNHPDSRFTNLGLRPVRSAPGGL